MNQTSKKRNLTGKERALRWCIGICIFLAVLLVVLGFLFASSGYQTPPHGTDPLGDLGNLGSYLQGTTGSLWSLAGLLIIFVAFLAQQQQLTLQRRQFEQQSFENNFFQLLTLHNGIVDDLREKDGTSEGRSVFPVLHRMVTSVYRGRVDGDVSGDTESLAVACYEDVFDAQSELLGHYFRNLYHIIKFVDESELLDKKRYTSIVRAQLSSYEHVLLHYNGLSTYGQAKFKDLIQGYALLENMGPGLLMNPKHPTSYSRKAFGDDAPLFLFQGANAQPAQPPTSTTVSASA